MSTQDRNKKCRNCSFYIEDYRRRARGRCVYPEIKFNNLIHKEIRIATTAFGGVTIGWLKAACSSNRHAGRR